MFRGGIVRFLFLAALHFLLASHALAQGGFQPVRSFALSGGVCDGSKGSSRLLAASDGLLYGTAAEGGLFGRGAVFRMAANGSNYRVLRSFNPSAGDGRNPCEGVIEGADGALYGATRFGGGTTDFGAIFRINKDGSGYTNIHVFTGASSLGKYPRAGVIQASDGRLYGRTLSGGVADGATIFRLNTDGSGFAILHHSGTLGGNLSYAFSNLIEASDGKLYGTSTIDGNDTAGTVFSLNKDGSEYTVLHHFARDAVDGSFPEGGVIEGRDGKLYGTTSLGGPDDAGVIFCLNKDGSGYVVLHEFSFDGIGANYPVGDLHQGPGGTLFGVTYFGGSDDNGTIYAITPAGTNFTVLHSFLSNPNAGEHPNATLVRGSDGGIYGTTVSGGTNGCGAIFRLAPIRTAITKEPSGYRVHITGVAGQRYAIQRASFPGAGWSEIGVVTNVGGTAEYLDTSPNASAQFYKCRLVVPP